MNKRTQLKKIRLSHGRSLWAASSKARQRSAKWIVYLQESGADFQKGSRRELESLVGSEISSSYNYLVINKPGLGPKGISPLEFELSFRRRLRVSDALVVMKRLIPESSEIVLVGYSEGAYLAPQVAVRDRRVKKVAMIGGGTRGWLKEELSNAKSSKRKSLNRLIKMIERHPRSLKKWNGFSYATWNSYKEDSTLVALKKLRVPALAILGAKDKVIDLKSARKDLKRLAAKKPIDLYVFKNCGHSFKGHWRPVRRILESFLISAYRS